MVYSIISLLEYHYIGDVPYVDVGNAKMTVITAWLCLGLGLCPCLVSGAIWLKGTSSSFRENAIGGRGGGFKFNMVTNHLNLTISGYSTNECFSVFFGS